VLDLVVPSGDHQLLLVLPQLGLLTLTLQTNKQTNKQTPVGKAIKHKIKCVVQLTDFQVQDLLVPVCQLAPQALDLSGGRVQFGVQSSDYLHAFIYLCIQLTHGTNELKQYKQIELKLTVFSQNLFIYKFKK